MTGANGFVGSVLCAEAVSRGFSVRAAVRTESILPAEVEVIPIANVDASVNWHAALQKCDAVVHLAARVHVMHELSQNPLAEFRKVNVDGTRHLAESAARAGVKRFVYVSSIGVNGTHSSLPFTELNNPNPQNAYALSKWEAEQALHDVFKRTGLEVVIVRPPLVYGINAPGNFAQMLRVLQSGFPLPLASVHNQRDFIYVENLVDALITCATHPDAAGQTYLVSDGESVATPTLIRNLAKALGKRCHVFPFPVFIMRFLAGLLGKSSAVDKLTQSLQINSGKIRKELGWKPPYTMEQGLKATADWYLKTRNKT